MDGLNGDSGGADGDSAYVVSVVVAAPHPVVVEAVAVEAKEFVDECFERALGVSVVFRMLVIYLLAAVGLEAHKSSSKQILHVAAGILLISFVSSVTICIVFNCALLIATSYSCYCLSR